MFKKRSNITMFMVIMLTMATVVATLFGLWQTDTHREDSQDFAIEQNLDESQTDLDDQYSEEPRKLLHNAHQFEGSEEDSEEESSETIDSNESKVVLDQPKQLQNDSNSNILESNAPLEIVNPPQESTGHSSGGHSSSKKPEVPDKDESQKPGEDSNNDTSEPEKPDDNDKPQNPETPDDKDESQNPEEPDDNNKPEEPEVPDVPGGSENPDDPEEELIIIDTSNWKFEGIDVVYDGKEHEALVTGLPDYVTPVYVDNKQTNAGTYTAYATFEVPEGYAVPDRMETKIVISKAVISSIELDKMWMRTDLVKGTITITPPASVPKGVLCTYKVNGENVGSSYTIKDTGIYPVEATFDLTEAMKQNYTLTNTVSKAVYQVNPEMWSNPKYNLYINELGSQDGKKKVEIWFDYVDSSFHTGGVEWYIRYDYNVLELSSSTKGSSMTMGRQSEYKEDSAGLGYAMGNYYTYATLLTLEFDVLDESATDMAINLTSIDATSSDDFLKYYTNGTGIILNQESNLISVTLPTAITTKGLSMQMNMLETVLTEMEEPTEEGDAETETKTEEPTKEGDAETETKTEEPTKEGDAETETETEEPTKEGDAGTETETEEPTEEGDAETETKTEEPTEEGDAETETETETEEPTKEGDAEAETETEDPTEEGDAEAETETEDPTEEGDAETETETETETEEPTEEGEAETETQEPVDEDELNITKYKSSKTLI